MDLYLHIGTEKTGSSYLQTVAALNREVLAKNRFIFPKGRLEKQMISGQISDGNAQNITDAISENNFGQVEKILENYKSNLSPNNESLLLSNELLVIALSSEANFKGFLEVIRNVGIGDTKMLLVLRDPVDQALSLFKHRSKFGIKSKIEDWSENSYVYGKCLEKFIDNALYSEITLTCRKYSKNSGSLERIFFRDWLGINDSLIQPENAVNPSLTLSELFVIDSISKTDQELAQEIYERYLKLPKKIKAKEPNLEEYYKRVLTDVVSYYDDTWKKCNSLLASNEQLNIPEKKGVLNQTKIISLNKDQIEILSNLINDLTSISFITKHIFKKLKNKIRKLYRLFFTN